MVMFEQTGANLAHIQTENPSKNAFLAKSSGSQWVKLASTVCSYKHFNMDTFTPKSSHLHYFCGPRTCNRNAKTNIDKHCQEKQITRRGMLSPSTFRIA